MTLRKALPSRIGSARAVVALILAAAASLAAGEAHAVGTRTFDLAKLSDLEGGDLTGVSADSRGRVRAGWSLGKLPLQGADTTWSAAVTGDGSVFIGTGNEGKIIKVTGGQASIV